MWGVDGCPLSWAPCCETWLKFEGKVKIAVWKRKEKMIACGEEKKN